MPNFRMTSGLMMPDRSGVSVLSCEERETGAGGAPFFSLSLVLTTLSAVFCNDSDEFGVSDFTFSGSGGVGNFTFSS